jgi:precorrin-2 dehydrogenase / sirohydrochlorin ferrochelatase
MQQGYPILLDVSNRLIVIVGGGSVAVRKSAALLDAGASRIRIVAPKIDDRISRQVECILEEYRAEHLADASLVFAATNSREVNDAVTRNAKTRGILVNQADDSSASDFTTPAQLKRGPVTIAVSAGSAALAVAIRDGLGSRFDDRWQRMAEAMQELRPMLQNDARLDDAARHQAFRNLASDEAMNVLARDGMEGLRSWISHSLSRYRRQG